MGMTQGEKRRREVAAAKVGEYTTHEGKGITTFERYEGTPARTQTNFDLKQDLSAGAKKAVSGGRKAINWATSAAKAGGKAYTFVAKQTGGTQRHYAGYRGPRTVYMGQPRITHGSIAQARRRRRKGKRKSGGSGWPGMGSGWHGFGS